MESSEQISRRLFLRTPHGIKLGLDRICEAAKRCGNPHTAYPSLHVAGTNGKGSVCAYLESSLRRLGFKTGLFTSPHIVRFEERFIINGKPITPEKWVEVFRDTERIIDELDLTFFEAATLLAFELFKREKVQWAVFETGMGGRLDATNILAPAVSVITRIAMDHMEYLGNDLSSIAKEKLGIVKKGVPLVMAEPLEPEIKAMATEWRRQTGGKCILVSNSMAQTTGIIEGRHCFIYRNREFILPLAGPYQIQNSLCAISTLIAAGFNDLERIAAGIAKTFLPGRFHRVTCNDKTVVFDVGHNPDAAQSFIDALTQTYPGRKICMVTGIMKDKDGAGVIEQYCKKASRVILTKPECERSAETARLRLAVPDWYKGEIAEIRHVADAVSAAMKSPEEIVCVAGSFFTVGEGMTALGVEPYSMR
jgi:dihydrofolate synthase/folylpolyglutamate synthase